MQTYWDPEIQSVVATQWWCQERKRKISAAWGLRTSSQESILVGRDTPVTCASPCPAWVVAKQAGWEAEAA